MASDPRNGWAGTSQSTTKANAKFCVLEGATLCKRRGRGWLASEQLFRAGPGEELVGHGPSVRPCSHSLGHDSIASRWRNKKDVEIQWRLLGWLGAKAWSVGGAVKGTGSPSSVGRGKLRGELPTAVPWECL